MERSSYLHHFNIIFLKLEIHSVTADMVYHVHCSVNMMMYVHCSHIMSFRQCIISNPSIADPPSILQHSSMEQRPPSPILRGQLISPEHWCSVQYFELDHKLRFSIVKTYTQHIFHV